MGILYAPRVGPVLFADPKVAGLEPKDVWISLSSGQRIHGWWIASQLGPARGTIVHFHGNAENLTSHYMLMSWVTERGYDYFIFDYPGYGLSEGEPNAALTVEAGEKALAWVHQYADSRPLIVYGHSLGGMVAQAAVVGMKKVVPFCDVILDSSFSSYRSVARRKLSMHWWTWLLQPLGYLVMSDAAAVDPADLSPIPVLVIHNRLDPVVEFPNGEQLFERLKEPKEFWRLGEGGHSSTFRIKGQEQRQRLMERLRKTCPAVPRAN